MNQKMKCRVDAQHHRRGLPRTRPQWGMVWMPFRSRTVLHRIRLCLQHTALRLSVRQRREYYILRTGSQNSLNQKLISIGGGTSIEQALNLGNLPHNTSAQVSRLSVFFYIN